PRTILKPKSSDVIHVAERHYCGPVLERPALKESHQLVALGNDISYSLTVPTDLGLVGVGRSTRSEVAVETFPDRGHVNPICIARKPPTLIVRSPNSHSSLLGSAAYASNNRLGKSMGLLLFCAFHKVGLCLLTSFGGFSQLQLAVYPSFLVLTPKCAPPPTVVPQCAWTDDDICKVGYTRFDAVK